MQNRKQLQERASRTVNAVLFSKSYQNMHIIIQNKGIYTQVHSYILFMKSMYWKKGNVLFYFNFFTEV